MCYYRAGLARKFKVYVWMITSGNKWQKRALANLKYINKNMRKRLWYPDIVLGHNNWDLSGTCWNIAGCEIPSYHGDTYCDDENNNEACFFDGGDCCGSNVNTQYCTLCQCLEGGSNCNGNAGNGYCDDINNNLACNSDGGDCCLIVRISLTNELLSVGYAFLNGDYERLILSNGQTSWISSDYGIWSYISPSTGTLFWLIGDLACLGGDQCGIDQIYLGVINDFYGLTDDENEWMYVQGSSWISPTDQSDIQIICVNDN